MSDPNPLDPNMFNRIAAVMRERIGPDYPTMLINLLDALRTYVRVNERIGKDLLDENAIAPEQFKRGQPMLQRCQLLLTQLKEHEVNPSLGGLIKAKK